MKKIDLINKYLILGLNKNHLNDIIQNELNISKSGLFLVDEIEEEKVKKIEKKIKRLQKKEPIEYITNKSLFYSIEFFVDNRVLIPRNDSEIMVEKTIKESKKYDDILLIDVGTGSSCIPISISKNTKIEKIIVIDISKDALKVSKKNIIKHDLKEAIKQLNSNLLEKLLNKKIKNKNLIITANLPYIKDGDFRNMSKETIDFEPNIALFGGEKTGFELYEKLINQIFVLKINNDFENIILFIEIGFDQYDYSNSYLKKYNLKHEYFKDNFGINRCIKIVF
ncbi:MAG: tRNA (adenine(22)-N(1))-methyltransferase TrmK [Candidatus Gracilibacteria bacterium]|nr:tRNA (adenine(22)-N(1))-methyltransferase TrmK [Candidatus Gracilibacteria bacterium]